MCWLAAVALCSVLEKDYSTTNLECLGLYWMCVEFWADYLQWRLKLCWNTIHCLEFWGNKTDLVFFAEYQFGVIHKLGRLHMSPGYLIHVAIVPPVDSRFVRCVYDANKYKWASGAESTVPRYRHVNLGKESFAWESEIVEGLKSIGENTFLQFYLNSDGELKSVSLIPYRNLAKLICDLLGGISF